MQEARGGSFATASGVGVHKAKLMFLQVGMWLGDMEIISRSYNRDRGSYPHVNVIFFFIFAFFFVMGLRSRHWPRAHVLLFTNAILPDSQNGFRDTSAGGLGASV